jgi:hypothetical protein
MDLIKLKIEQIKEMGRETALIPINEAEYNKYNKLKLNEVVRANIKKYREYHTHKHYFRMLQVAVDNGILENELVLENKLVIRKKIINSIVVENRNNEVEALRYIVQLLFLTGEVKTNLDGSKQIVRGSIEYSKLDENAFKEFKDRVAGFLAYNLGCTVYDIENNAV